MTEKELTAEEVATALNAQAWRGRTDWHTQADFIVQHCDAREPWSVFTTPSTPILETDIADARAIVAGWRAAEELAALKAHFNEKLNGQSQIIDDQFELRNWKSRLPNCGPSDCIYLPSPER